MNEKQTIDLLLLLMAKKMKEKLDERKLKENRLRHHEVKLVTWC